LTIDGRWTTDLTIAASHFSAWIIDAHPISAHLFRATSNLATGANTLTVSAIVIVRALKGMAWIGDAHPVSTDLGFCTTISVTTGLNTTPFNTAKTTRTCRLTLIWRLFGRCGVIG
jgi:hypothetical protein